MVPLEHKVQYCKTNFATNLCSKLNENWNKEFGPRYNWDEKTRVKFINRGEVS